MTEEFHWPCWKRYAHGKHVIKSAEESIRLRDTQLANMVVLNEAGHLQCSGVKSHPATMIGGNVPEEVWSDGSGEVWKAGKP